LRPQWAGRDVQIDEEVRRCELTMWGDRYRLEQVFRNLFENSLSACQDPATISVVCSRNRRSDEIVVAVRDNGPGMTSAQRKLAFHPFFTTKTAGTGLGLPIVRRIMEAHGGTIEFGKQGFRGTEFVMTFPEPDPRTSGAQPTRAGEAAEQSLGN
jgi:signal transduction histidine kinase